MFLSKKKNLFIELLEVKQSVPRNLTNIIFETYHQNAIYFQMEVLKIMLFQKLKDYLENLVFIIISILLVLSSAITFISIRYLLHNSFI